MPTVTSLATSLTMSSWNGLPGGTSSKSATQPLSSVPERPPGFVTTTSWTEPAGFAGNVAVIV